MERAEIQDGKTGTPAGRWDVRGRRKFFASLPGVLFGILAVLAVAGVAAGRLASSAPRAEPEPQRTAETEAALARAMKGLEAAVRGLQEEYALVQAGRMTERESDERSRAVHAPVFRRLLEDFSRVRLHSSDPRLPMVAEARRITALTLEALEMQSVYREGSNKPEPADPQRMAAIEAELRRADARFRQLKEEARGRPRL